MKALVVVDYQNDFVSGSLGFPEAQRIEPIIVNKIGEYRKKGGRIIFTLDTHDENYLNTSEGKKLPIVHCVEGTEGHRLCGAVADCLCDDDIVITKPTFGSPELAKFIKQMNFEEVEFCGLVTDICVVSNAVITKAYCPETRIVVDSGATASPDKENYEAALRVMKSVQIDVI